MKMEGVEVQGPVWASRLDGSWCEVHLSFCQFGPVWVQVVDDPVEGSRQRDSMCQEDDQDRVGEQSREVDHLERQQTP